MAPLPKRNYTGPRRTKTTSFQRQGLCRKASSPVVLQRPGQGWLPLVPEGSPEGHEVRVSAQLLHEDLE